MARLLKAKPWPSRIEDDADTGWYSVYFDFTTPPPESLAVTIGELAHDLRSALDHLVWRESIEFLGREPTEDEGRVIGFPFAWKELDFRSAQVLRYVSKDAAALLKRHQPCNRSNSNEAASLGVVQWFNNRDKHRTVQVTAVSAPHKFAMEQLFIGFRKGARIAEVMPHLPPGQRLKGDTKVASVRFAPGGLDPQVSVEGDAPFNPSFGELPAHLRGADVQVSINVVREIISDFAGLIP